jgi:hypothetical protein
MVALFDFAYPIVISLSTYLICDIPNEMILNREGIPILFFFALLTNIILCINATVLVLYCPERQDASIFFIGMIFMQNIIDLGKYLHTVDIDFSFLGVF